MWRVLLLVILHSFHHHYLSQNRLSMRGYCDMIVSILLIIVVNVGVDGNKLLVVETLTKYQDNEE